MARNGKEATGVVPLSPVGEPALAGSAGVAGPATPTIAELTQAIEREVETSPEAQQLQTHPGVGPLTALAFVLVIGKADRFQCGKQVASYLGLVPLGDSSGKRRRLAISRNRGTRCCGSC